MMRRYSRLAPIAALVAALFTTVAHSQVPAGLIDLNTADRETLTGLPNLTDALVGAVVDGRPFATIVELNAALTEAGLDAEKATELYRQAFVHVNLNTGSKAEFLLIPGAGKRMAHEFDEYRPWKSWAQFDKEIGKYVGDEETARLKQYVFLPIDLNAATDDQLKTIPGLGKKMLHELKEYRPWKSKAHFDKEIGKYVGEAETARLWRYVVIK